ncbi:helix-turn-helix domain-containing protein [Priestia endophytica]|uniref:helix-turn-helix domain-containing protein n=1 Tax=Priestia endophytica TaxID=135735 RepID=UPI00124C63CC|nr:helix-turn-helix transcriptional regulator [Priestia endophytica]
MKQLLKQKGITMTELYEITGISQNALNLISNGKSNGIQFNTLDKILEATNSKIEELIEHGEELYSLFIRLEHNKSKKSNFLGWGFKG